MMRTCFMAHKIIYLYTIKKRLYIYNILYYTGKIIKKHIATLFTLRRKKSKKSHTHIHHISHMKIPSFQVHCIRKTSSPFPPHKSITILFKKFFNETMVFVHYLIYVVICLYYDCNYYKFDHQHHHYHH